MTVPKLLITGTSHQFHTESNASLISQHLHCLQHRPGKVSIIDLLVLFSLLLVTASLNPTPKYMIDRQKYDTDYDRLRFGIKA